MGRSFELHSGAALRLALLALTVPIVVASAVFIWQDHNARRDAIITQVNLKSAQINAQLEDFVHKVDGATGVFAATWVNGHGLKAVDSAELDTMNSYLSRFVENRPHFIGAFVTDVDGTIVASSDPSLVGDRVGDLELYDGARSGNEFSASDVITPSSEEAPPFALFLQPLRWDSTAPQGFLVAQAELATISGVLDMSVGFPESAKSGIFDSKGRILAGTGYEAPHPGLATGRDISRSAVWAQAADRPIEEWFGPGLDNVQRIVFFSYPDATPWVATVAYAQSELFSPLWKRLWTFGGVLAVTLVATVWVGETLIRRDRRSVAALEKERVTLDAVMNGATDGIMVVDADNAVNFVNRRLTEMIDLDAGSSSGRPLRAVRKLISEKGDDPAEVSAQIDLAVTAGSKVLVEGLSMKQAIGLELEMTPYPVVSATGAPLGRTLVFHDVTKSKAVQRMKSQFLTTASHQLRTPMTSILTFAELSLTRDAEGRKQRQWLTLIHEQATRMVATINSILNVSQIESGRLDLNLEYIDADEACRSVVTGFESLFPDHAFELRIPESARIVRADGGRFRQIVENLVDNAVKYSPAPGKVVVSADSPVGGMVRFQVSDDGVGISREGMPNLFVPFSRVADDRTSEVTGSGLGLYI